MTEPFGIVISAWEPTSPKGQPLRVTVQLLGGLATLVRVWLNDGVSQSELEVTQPSRLGLRSATLLLVPQTVGTWHLWARARSLDERSAETGRVRTVTVSEGSLGDPIPCRVQATVLMP